MSPDANLTVRLPRSIAEAILGHARDARPLEACGLVVGSGRAWEGGAPLRYEPCRNAAASPTRFSVHRDDLLRVLGGIDRSGEELWAVVHSHVRTAAIPSSTDLREAAWPAAVYLVVSLAADAPEGELRAWRISGAGVGPEAAAVGLEIVEDVAAADPR